MTAVSPQVGEKRGPFAAGPFSAADLACYAAASGDDNPLHLDPAVAAAAGLDRPPMHGMLIMGQAEAALAAWWPRSTLTRLSAKFIRPVPSGEYLALSGRVARLDADGTFVLRLLVHDERGQLAMMGEATLRDGEQG